AEDPEQIGLADAGGGEERAAIETKPACAIRRAVVDDLGRHVTPETNIDSPAVDESGEVVLKFDVAAILQVYPHADGPAVSGPRPVPLSEAFILPASATSGATHAAETRV